jgi:hypothetical protein
MGTKAIAISEDDWTKEFGKSLSLKMLKKLSSLICQAKRWSNRFVTIYTFLSNERFISWVCEVLDFVRKMKEFRLSDMRRLTDYAYYKKSSTASEHRINYT